MGSVSGQGTTFNVPNYVGELFAITPTDTPFLSMIGGLTGGVSHSAKVKTWQTSDNAAAEQPALLEGGDPTYAERTRTEVSNALQIFQYGVEVSYTKQAAVGQLAATNSNILGTQPVQNELQWQLNEKLKRAATDVEYSFLQGTYALPADNVTARKIRGLKNAITTNTVAAGSAPVTRGMIQEVLREMATSGAPFSNVVAFAGAFNKQQITDIYGYAPDSRNVGGLNIKQVETDFGNLGVVFDRHMPTGEIYFVEMSVCEPVFMPIPGKGHFFLEEKPASGSSFKWQLYGEITLNYGPELWHGSITGTATSA